MNPSVDRMPPIARERMTEAQRDAADELIAGPRKGVKGPFIPLLRSPELMARLQRVGEYLRFGSALPPRLSEFATLVVARHWTQQFEWAVHVPLLAIAAGTLPATVDALRARIRPATMSDDEALVYAFVTQLIDEKGVSDESFARPTRRAKAVHRDGAGLRRVGKRLSALGRHREDRSREHRGAPPRRCRTTVPPPACPRPTRSATPM